MLNKIGDNFFSLDTIFNPPWRDNYKFLSGVQLILHLSLQKFVLIIIMLHIKDEFFGS